MTMEKTNRLSHGETLSPEDVAWLRRHRQAAEGRRETLKTVGMVIGVVALGIALAIIVAFLATAVFSIPVASSDTFLLIITAGFVGSLFAADHGGHVFFFSVLFGTLIGLAIIAIYAAPFTAMFTDILLSQYPISMQVSYPNIEITQYCEPFAITESGYVNGQPIGQLNTTQCLLPKNMSHDTFNMYNCAITGKNIICINNISTYVKWNGTILNVSNR